jgi:hypothetical protein
VGYGADPLPHQRSLLVRSVALIVSLTAAASAAPKDSEAQELRKEAMEGDYLGTRFKNAEQKLQKALKACGKQKCEDSVLAELHRDLAIVYIAGLKKQDKGKKEMKAALKADPNLALNADFTTPEVEKVFVDAGGTKPEPEPEPEVDLEDEEPKPETLAPEEDSPSGGAKNWFSLSFQQDFLFYGETTGVCASDTQLGAKQYQCFLQGQSYGGPIYDGSGNQLAGGWGVATRRVLVGYERLFGDNLTAGVRLGFAFGGSPKATTPDASAFLPLHAELRGTYWFGEKPFEGDGLRPFGGLAGGIAAVDGHVAVEYFEDAAGYAADSKGKLDAWRKTGTSFIGLHAGLAYAIKTNHALLLELRLMQMLGASATGGALSIGYQLGL